MIPTLNPMTTGGHVPFIDFLDAAYEAGFPAIEYSIEPFAQVASEQSEAAAIELLTSRNLQIGSFMLPVEFRKDEHTFQEQLKELSKLASLARKLGTDRCCTWMLPSTDEPVAEYTSRFIRRLRACAKVLGDQGIRFGIEWVGPKTMRTMKHDFIHTIPGTLEFIDAIGENNTGLLFDSFHWFTSHASIEDILGLTEQQIVLVHINDAPNKPKDEQIDMERLLPGEGIIDLAGMLGALRKIGYNHAVSVETFGTELPNMHPNEAAIKTKAAVDRVLGNIRSI
ncbi:sugar phosphate isomerase/epimerase [Paenibacillus psychroresistens]|uniref:Sugar phosphate isomerase/epimerase n=1 Tax=Paenibacillus psychroresistens TaxID=1778678 RepID=A0A6B8RI41_9BACL|nr:sugar phosphate isomerase/epimerase family protein [Paenibacillus psychroresistens]QGQ95222.1 sugar phosphate isomerase/epimerase [Paenibacillus psychroresistens]